MKGPSIHRLISRLDDIHNKHPNIPKQKQAFGNFQNQDDVRYSKEERKRFGRFYYRFPFGTSWGVVCPMV